MGTVWFPPLGPRAILYPAPETSTSLGRTRILATFQPLKVQELSSLMTEFLCVPFHVMVLGGGSVDALPRPV